MGGAHAMMPVEQSVADMRKAIDRLMSSVEAEDQYHLAYMREGTLLLGFGAAGFTGDWAEKRSEPPPATV